MGVYLAILCEWSVLQQAESFRKSLDQVYSTFVYVYGVCVYRICSHPCFVVGRTQTFQRHTALPVLQPEKNV